MAPRGIGLLVLAALVAGALPAQQSIVTELRSLLPFAPPTLQFADLPFTALPGAVRDVPFALEAGAECVAADAELLRLLERRHSAALESGRLRVVPQPDCTTVVLHGERDAVAVYRRDLDCLEAIVARPIEVTAWRLPLPDGALPTTVWDAARVRLALASTTPAWTAAARTRAGGQVRLAEEQEAGVVHDLDVEIAQGNRIFDPKADVVFGGTRLSLVVDVLPGDELLLRGGWLQAERRALDAFDLGPEAGVVDQPELATAAVAFGGRIASGEALVCAGRGGDVGPAGFLLVVSARFVEPPPAPLAADLLVQPAGAWFPRCAARSVDDRSGFATTLATGVVTPDDLRLLVEGHANVTAAFAHETLVVQGDAVSLRQVEALLHDLAGAWTNLRFLTRVAAPGVAPLEVVVPTVAHWPVAAFVGRERAVVVDSDVQIGQGVAGPDPVVAAMRSGLAFAATAVPDRAGMHVVGTWATTAHDALRVVEGGKGRLPMQIPTARHTVLPWDATMPFDHGHELGEGPAWTTGGASTMVVVHLSAPAAAANEPRRR